MNKDRFMKDFNGEKIFSLEYDKETLRDMLLLKQEEIEDLKKQVALLVKDDESSQQTIINQRQEIEILNNIIKELEKLELYEYTPDYDYDENLVEGYTPFNIENYIEELKGSNKENV